MCNDSLAKTKFAGDVMKICQKTCLSFPTYENLKEKCFDSINENCSQRITLNNSSNIKICEYPFELSLLTRSFRNRFVKEDLVIPTIFKQESIFQNLGSEDFALHKTSKPLATVNETVTQVKRIYLFDEAELAGKSRKKLQFAFRSW